jgi:transcriptional regulator with XRE-family HTH domain
MEIVGKNAKLARETNGFSQANVAEFLKVDQSLISKFENGSRSMQADMLERLANLYGYKVSDFENEECVSNQRIKTAYRSNGLLPEDLEVVHDIRRIGMNLFFMTELMGNDSER